MSKTRSGRKILSLLLTLCMVLSLTPAMGITASAWSAPSFDARNGQTVTAEYYTSATWGTYYLAGWYTDIDGMGMRLVGEPEGSTTYYAKWTVGESGKTVVTTPLDFNSMTGDDTSKLETEGWAWYETESMMYAPIEPINASNHPANTLILDGATIDCSGVADCGYAIKLPPDATIFLEGSSTILAGSGRISDDRQGI